MIASAPPAIAGDPFAAASHMPPPQPAPIDFAALIGLAGPGAAPDAIKVPATVAVVATAPAAPQQPAEGDVQALIAQLSPEAREPQPPARTASAPIGRVPPRPVATPGETEAAPVEKDGDGREEPAANGDRAEEPVDEASGNPIPRADLVSAAGIAAMVPIANPAATFAAPPAAPASREPTPTPAPAIATSGMLRPAIPPQATPDAKPRQRAKAAATDEAVEAREPAPSTLPRPVDSRSAPLVQQTQAGDVASIAPAGTAAAVAPAEILIAHRLDLAQGDAWLDRLAQDIARTADGDARLRFALAPEHLGRLTVDLANGADGTAIRLTTESEQAQRIVADAQPRLIAEARAQGLRISDTQVDFGPRSGGQQHQPGGAEQGAAAGASSQGGNDRARPNFAWAEQRRPLSSATADDPRAAHDLYA